MQALNKASLEARHISLSYGATPVLQGVNLRVEPGEFFALLGPSGSGKSTLLRLIAGFNQHQSGELLVDGKDITGVPPHARNVGMVFQNYALWLHMTVWDNVAFGLVERRESRDAIRRKVGDVLALVDLSDYAQRRPAQLSGGQQQRVALARALITQPRVLLLDEPLSALDPFLRIQMRAELRRWQQELGLTFIHVTHSQEEAMALADTMVVMNQGHIEQVGSPHEIYNQPATEFIARFMGGHNVLDTPAGKIAVRNDHMQIAPAAEGTPGMRGISARITDVEYQGTYVLLGLQAQNAGGETGVSVMLPEATFAARPYTTGEPVNLDWTDAHAHGLRASVSMPATA